MSGPTCVEHPPMCVHFCSSLKGHSASSADISDGNAPALSPGLCGRSIHYSRMTHLFLSSTGQGPPPPWRIQFSQPEAPTHSPHPPGEMLATPLPPRKLLIMSPGHTRTHLSQLTCSRLPEAHRGVYCDWELWVEKQAHYCKDLLRLEDPDL